jgi:hypothetical protein
MPLTLCDDGILPLGIHDADLTNVGALFGVGSQQGLAWMAR